MAFINCDCGEQVELNQQVGHVTCAGCGQQYTIPQTELESDVVGAAQVESTPRSTPLTPTMVEDLPAITQFEQGYRESIVAMATHAMPAVGGAVAGAWAAGTPNPPATPDLYATPRRNPTPGQASVDTEPMGHATTELSPGLRLLDRYEVQRKIGQGGMSTVYEAYDEVRGENVALKVLLADLSRQQVLQDRFLQEGRLASNFSHPNIARVYDLHQTESGVFLSMELLQGATLRHDMNRRRDQRQGYQPAEVLKILQQLSDALETVHDEGVVHRDLKPENIWISLDGTVKVMDFGIARDTAGTAYTTGGRGSGTPYYIAPEQMAASPHIDGRADQYSIAVVLYELLTTELPQGMVVAPHERNVDVPRKLSQAIVRALDADPANRFDSVGDFLAAAQFRQEKTLVQKTLVPALAALVLVGVAAGAVRWLAPLLQTKEVPVWEDVAPQTLLENEQLRFTVRNKECTLDANTLEFKLLADAPVGAELDAKSGEFLWTPTEAQGPGDYTFTVMAVATEEGRPPSVKEQTFQVSVGEQVDVPVIEPLKPLVIREHEEGRVQVMASDPNIPQVGLRYELPDPPAGMQIDSSKGVLSWTPDENQGGTSQKVAVRAYLDQEDGPESYTERFVHVRVEESIDAPVITAQERLAGVVGQAVNFRVTARDPNTPEINHYFRLANGGRLGMTIDPKTGELFWTPSEAQAGKDYEVSVQVCYDGGSRVQVLAEQPVKVLVAELPADNGNLTGIDGAIGVAGVGAGAVVGGVAGQVKPGKGANCKKGGRQPGGGSPPVATANGNKQCAANGGNCETGQQNGTPGGPGIQTLLGIIDQGVQRSREQKNSQPQSRGPQAKSSSSGQQQLNDRRSQGIRVQDLITRSRQGSNNSQSKNNAKSSSNNKSQQRKSNKSRSQQRDDAAKNLFNRLKSLP